MLDKIGAIGAIDSFEVVCDETNNTGETIARNELIVDIKMACSKRQWPISGGTRYWQSFPCLLDAVGFLYTLEHPIDIRIDTTVKDDDWSVASYAFLEYTILDESSEVGSV